MNASFSVAVSSPSLDEVVGTNIRRLRRRAGWSQKELALQLLVVSTETWSHQKISVRELGKTPTTLTEACEIAYVLGVPLTQLLAPSDDVVSVQLGFITLIGDEMLLDLVADPPGRYSGTSRVLDEEPIPTRKRRATDDLYDQLDADVDIQDFGNVSSAGDPSSEQWMEPTGEWDWTGGSPTR